MKKLTIIPSALRRVAMGTATEQDQMIAFIVVLPLLLIPVFIWGHPYQAYYYSK